MYVVKMDEEGRIAIPQEIISAQGFGKDTAFLVANMNDTLILKKVIEKGAQIREEPVQEKEEAVDISQYTTKENATTSLGDLLKGFKFD